MKPSVLVGLSGGVDSALTAAVLQQRGLDPVGLYCIMHDADATGLADAQRVADHLGIPLKTADLRKEFRERVVSDFIDCYARAKTPNPCIVCNPLVKFKALCDVADELGIEKIATGHYADVGEEAGRYFIRAVKEKDQSYMLYRLTQEQLRRLILPLANTSKEENRKQAEELGIPIFRKPDSQDICFIKGESYVEFIERELGKFPEGLFWLKEEDRPVGSHKGLIHYTVGQRKNLGIALGVPVYVSSLDIESNRVYLSKADVVGQTEISVLSPVYQKLDSSVTEFDAWGKIRFAAKPSPCRVSVKKFSFTAAFAEGQRAVTPGQSVVFYDEDGNFVKKESYSELLLEYIELADTETGVYPLTEDLKYIIQQRGEYVGWWDAESPNFIFKDATGLPVEGLNTEIAWLFMCCYEN